MCHHLLGPGKTSCGCVFSVFLGKLVYMLDPGKPVLVLRDLRFFHHQAENVEPEDGTSGEGSVRISAGVHRAGSTVERRFCGPYCSVPRFYCPPTEWGGGMKPRTGSMILLYFAHNTWVLGHVENPWYPISPLCVDRSFCQFSPHVQVCPTTTS